MTWKTHSKLRSIQSHVLSPDFPENIASTSLWTWKSACFWRAKKSSSNTVLYNVGSFSLHIPNHPIHNSRSFQEVYLRRRACEALGCQGKEMGAIGTLALKKAAEDRRNNVFSNWEVLWGWWFFGICNSHIIFSKRNSCSWEASIWNTRVV